MNTPSHHPSNSNPRKVDICAIYITISYPSPLGFSIILRWSSFDYEFLSIQFPRVLCTQKGHCGSKEPMETAMAVQCSLWAFLSVYYTNLWRLIILCHLLLSFQLNKECATNLMVAQIWGLRRCWYIQKFDVPFWRSRDWVSDGPIVDYNDVQCQNS